MRAGEVRERKKDLDNSMYIPHFISKYPRNCSKKCFHDNDVDKVEDVYVMASGG